MRPTVVTPRMVKALFIDPFRAISSRNFSSTLYWTSSNTPNPKISYLTIFSHARTCLPPCSPNSLRTTLYMQERFVSVLSKCISSMSPPSDRIVQSNDTISGPEFGDQQVELDEVGESPKNTSIPVRAFFLSTSVDLKSLVEQNKQNSIPPSSRMTNHVIF